MTTGHRIPAVRISQGLPKGEGWASLRRFFLFLLSALIFIVSLVVMKEGATPLSPVLRGLFAIHDPANTLGFGWFLASLALSGSPVAAASLTFLDAGALTPLECFTMIAGSRLGAAFIVLLVGFLYVLRGKQRQVSLGAGLLSILVTQSTYLLALPLGYLALTHSRVLGVATLPALPLQSPFERLLQPAVALLEGRVPVWVLFPIGFALILVSFALFDRALPDLHLESTGVGRINRLLYRPAISFILGAGLTALTLSVSLSLSVLVPLSVRGYIRQENAIPYIMGANITTFADTLLAAALLANPAGVRIVAVHMLSVAVVSILILGIGFRPYERLLSRLTRTIGSGRLTLLLFLLLSLGVPLCLMLFA
jgi:sodium-dependent phosphate cotransporter